MRLVEPPHDTLHASLIQPAGGSRHFQLIPLPDVPRVRSANQRNILQLDPLTPHLLCRLRLQLLVPRRNLLRRQLAAGAKHRLREIMAQVRHEQAKRRRDSRRNGNQHARNIHLCRKLRRVNWTRTPKRHQAKLPRIVPLRYRYHPNTLHHTRVDHLHDALGRLLDGKPQRTRDALLDRRAGRPCIQRHRPPQQTPLAQPAQDQIRVRNRRLVPPDPIARRPRIRPGAPRTNPKRASGIYPRDAAPASPKSMNIHHRRLDRKPLDLALLRPPHLSSVRQRHVEARAPHVDGNAIFLPCLLGDGHRSNHPRGRSGQYRMHRTLDGSSRAHRPPVRLHDIQTRPKTNLRDAALQPAQIPLHHRRHICVDRSRAHPLVLFELRQNLMRQRNRNPRQSLPKSLSNCALMRRIRIGMQQAHSSSIHPSPRNLLHDPRQSILPNGNQNFSRMSNPLQQLEAQPARNQRISAPNPPIVQIRTILPPNLQHVPKPGSNHQRRSRPLPLQQRIRRYRRPMNEELHPARRRPVPLQQPSNPLGNPHRLIGRRRRRLGKLQPVRLRIVQRKIGERPADVHPKPIAHPSSFPSDAAAPSIPVFLVPTTVGS